MRDSPSPDSWRNIGAQPASDIGRKRPWQNGAATGDGERRWISKKNKRIIAGVSLAFLCIAVGVVFRWLSPFKSCLVTIGSGYEDNLLLPHNAHGMNGLTGLEKLSESDTGMKLRFPWQQPNKIRSTGAGALRELRPGHTWAALWDEVLKDVSQVRTLPFFAPRESTLVLAISLHTIVDNNEVYFLANDPRPHSIDDNAERTRTRVSFGDILESLKKLPTRRHIVLLLDIGQFDSHWPMAVFYNNVAQRLKRYEDDIKKLPNLVVICSADEDQRGWVSDEWQNSMFTHFVTEGLRGAAGKGSNRITAQKLFDYVEEKTQHWAETNRARKQKPFMMGRKGLAEIIEIVHASPDYQEQKPEDAPNRGFSSEQQTKILTEWQHWQQLRQLAPYAFNPHRWRVYQETLLRYEQLMRAGDPTKKAEELRKNKLEPLEDELRKDRALEEARRCQGGSFPMARVLGLEPMSEADLRGVYSDFYSAADGERKTLLTAWKEKHHPQDEQFVRVQLGRKLLLELDRKDDLEPSSTDLSRRDASIEASFPFLRRPAELHLLKMLCQDKHPDMPDGPVKLGLKTRVLAEETALAAHRDRPEERLPAYLYSEVIFSHFQKPIEDADEKRRAGEDLLFGQPSMAGRLKNHQEEAEKTLTAAGNMYRDTLKEIKALQTALAVRDEACGDLPYLSRWIGHFLIHGDPYREHINDLNRLPVLAEKLAELTNGLDFADEFPDLKATTQEVRDTHAALQKLYYNIGDGYGAAPHQHNWHEIDNALSIPCIRGEDKDVTLRLKLVKMLRDISSYLADAQLDDPGKAKLDTVIERQETIDERVKRQTKTLQNCLAPFDVKCDGKGSYTDIVLRSHLLGLDAAINEKADGTLRELIKAVNLCRVVPAGLSYEVRSVPYHPVEQLRRMRMHRLLLWQAKRTWLDHWFEPGQKENQESPYYLPTARSYCEAARDLIKALAHAESLKKMHAQQSPQEKQYTAEARLKGAKALDQFWADTQRDYPLTWQIDLLGEVPRGQPMWWVQAKDVRTPAPRQEILWRSDDKSLTAKYDLERAAVWGDAFDGAREVALHAVYRGQHLQNRFRFESKKADVIVHETPRPGRIGVAGRMNDKFSYGAVAILLDTSQSMLSPPEINNIAVGKEDRFSFAVKALEHVLEQIPDGTEISLFTFYDASNDAVVPEGGTGTKLYDKWESWDRKKYLGDLIARLDNFRKPMRPHPANPKKMVPTNFYNNSPIARGIVTCMDEGFSKKDGPKVVVALTDGEDNCSVKLFSVESKDPAELKKKAENKDAVRKMLREANETHLGTDVVVVCFMDKKNEEYEDAEYQFKDVEKFRPKVKGQRTKSKFTNEHDGAKLGETIFKMIQPRMELFDLADDELPIDGFRYPNHLIDQPGKKPKFAAAPPGYYRAKLPGLNHEPQGLSLDGSMYLLLKSRDLRFYLERGLLFEQPELAYWQQWTQSAPGRRDWSVMLMGNSYPVGSNARDSLEQLIAFENVKTAPGGGIPKDITQPRPGFVWLELEADKKLRLPTVHWRTAGDVPAPAYRVNVANWPDGASPKLTSWFWPENTDFFLSKSEFVDKELLEMNGDGIIGKFKMRGIESVRWDRQAAQPTLVIQGFYPPGKPIMVRLSEGSTKNFARNLTAEHHYFHAAGRYTAFFQGLPANFQATVAVVDVASFKDKAPSVTFPSGTQRMESFDPPAAFLTGDPEKLP